ncbi:hypothetical protein A1O1_06591 [Capronia coronata CBS 617.96]|uniref:U1-type domain-containing protein n=1 Tax=Capronia coronata CBS 617.96 TaxID=1182541 RepID=W9YAD0_9EURO|nr:uncharacterized protein A1O1_06591 [Capronia coronata CBS 617.96]EXJ86221.1 hypothetical protein A1O1_06591 [Capronia coronata CBS 617.96]
MSEYWKSTPKYWCKHCSTYVKDTPFERRQHESTGKHQGNLRRFLRDIQNSHERGEREKEKAKLEVERLSRVAGGSPSASPIPTTASSQSQSSTVRKAANGPQAAVDLKRQWAQLAEMGIKVPEQARSEVAMPGEWQAVEQKPTNETSEGVRNIGVRKRKLEEQEEDEEGEDAVVQRGWGSSTRRYPGDEKPDLDELLSGTISLKKEKNPPSAQLKDEPKETIKREDITSLKPGSGTDDEQKPSHVEALSDQHSPVKDEIDTVQPSQPLSDIPEEVPLPVFKKRKAKPS